MDSPPSKAGLEPGSGTSNKSRLERNVPAFGGRGDQGRRRVHLSVAMLLFSRLNDSS